MRKFLAFIVLILEFAILDVVVSFLFTFLVWCFAQISVLALAVRIFIYVLLGSTVIAIALAPMMYGSGLMIATSEAIAESKSGIRYVIFGTAGFVICALVVILNLLLNKSFSIVYTYLAIVAVIVGIVGYIDREK